VDGKFLRVDGKRFRIRGVTYGTFTPNAADELLPSPERARADLSAMVAAGVNTVRTYTTPPRWFLDLAGGLGLKVVAGVFWEGRQCLFDDSETLRETEAGFAREVETLAGHPAVLMVCLGNEIPPQVARWHGKSRVEGFLKRLRDRAKAIDPELLVTYASYPSTEFLDLSFLDVIGFNVYLEREREFRAYLARLQMVAGSRPLFVSELGLDSRRNGVERQAELLDWQLRAVWEKGLAGVTAYAWTDEWAVGGVPVEDWDFGFVDRQRNPKPALDVLRRNYTSTPYELRAGAWPKVTVVCCAYNAASTVGETLASLEQLTYPSYEVVVVDDGSRDETARIAAQHPFRLLRVENGGLSRARNLGIEAARGEIVAFIDSDAAADPDWLYFLVTQMEELNAAGCGGPNLSPPADPEAAQRIDKAPGNPVHVLLDNETAEHIPGCNMAFRKEVLQAIGGFDPTYRVAGDDVDVCWKILERGEELAFSPAAVVWHHRRASWRAYLKQQRGYGKAEVLLEACYPERYRLASGAVWRGRVYEGPQPNPTPWSLRGRERVRHGPQCRGLFQSVYAPQSPWWVSLAVTPSFYLLNASLALTGAACAWSGFPLWGLPLGAAALGVAASLGCCLEAALRMCSGEELPRAAHARRLLAVAALHFLQPWARWLGRVQGASECRRRHVWPNRSDQMLWAGWDRRDEWLSLFTRLLGEAGIEAREGDDWGRHDLEIRAFPGYTARIESVVEHQTTIRFRFQVGVTRTLRCVQAALVLLTLGAASTPATWPLLVPVGAALYGLHREKRRMSAALASVGRRAGAILGMVPLTKERLMPDRQPEGAPRPWAKGSWAIAGVKGGELHGASLQGSDPVEDEH
jgi:GT2 family glycosyltransferase